MPICVKRPVFKTNTGKALGADSFHLTFAEIEKIAGLPIDHSFLTCKKELTAYGYQVGKISMKAQTVAFQKLG